jgi:hypothetical protein
MIFHPLWLAQKPLDHGAAFLASMDCSLKPGFRSEYPNIQKLIKSSQNCKIAAELFVTLLDNNTQHHQKGEFIRSVRTRKFVGTDLIITAPMAY